MQVGTGDIEAVMKKLSAEMLAREEYELIYKEGELSGLKEPKPGKDEIYDEIMLSQSELRYLLAINQRHLNVVLNFYLHADNELAFAEIRALVANIRKAYGKSTNPTLKVLSTADNDFELKEVTVVPPELTIASHYNDDFANVADVVDKAVQRDRSGLVLLHGRPGTGKTSFIKHLIAEHPTIEFIYVPNDLVGELLKPTFISFMLKRRNSVIVIEDAERAIQSREQAASRSVVSTILQLTDGLFSDYLNLKIICTFNTDVSRIDKALFRKGRLLAFYEFSALSIAKSRALLATAGNEGMQVSAPMTLADIYNVETEGYDGPGKGRNIGFGK